MASKSNLSKHLIPRLTVAVLLTTLGLAVSNVAAQHFKAPIKIIVPYEPGGGTHVLVRLLGPGLSKELDQPIVIEKKTSRATMGRSGTGLCRPPRPTVPRSRSRWTTR
jgi:hypothetical protein